MKKYVVLTGCLILAISKCFGQIYAPVHWSYAAKKISSTQAVLFIKATVDDEWHIYSVNQKDGGPQKTSFVFNPSKDYQLTGNVVEPQPKRKYESAFSMDVFYFENAVIFQQKITLASPQTTVEGKVKFMVCNNERCLPPDEVTFKIPIK